MAITTVTTYATQGFTQYSPGEFVNTTTYEWQISPTVAALSGGGYVITWQSKSQDGDGYGVFAQRYDNAGNKLGGEFQVNTVTANWQAGPEITGLTGGGFAVTWRNFYSETGVGIGIFSQLYDANGNKVGGEVQVNTYPSTILYQQQISKLTDGGYIISWASPNGDTYNAIYAQRFDGAGQKVGGETKISQSMMADYAHISPLNNGGYVAAWQGSDGTTDGIYKGGIYMQVFDAQGARVGSETIVSDAAGGSFSYPKIITLKDGSYYVTWTKQAGTDQGIYARHYTQAGQAMAGETYLGASAGPSPIALEEGGFATVGNYVQAYDAAGVKVGDAQHVITGYQMDGQSAAALTDGSIVTTYAAYTRTTSGYDIYSRLYFPTTTVTGTPDHDNLLGTSHKDVLIGNGNNDTLTAGLGNDSLDGGAGVDTAVYSGLKSDYTVVKTAEGYTVTDLRAGVNEGVDTLTGVERLQFADTVTVLSSAVPHDFNGDGSSDLLFHNATTGVFAVWQASDLGSGLQVTPNVYGNTVDPSWKIEASFDFSGDGKADLMWRQDTTGVFSVWNGASSGFSQNSYGNAGVDASWEMDAFGDFNGDGKYDVIFRHTGGAFSEWQSTGNAFASNVYVNDSVDTTWQIQSAADFNGDGKDDLLWRQDGGAFSVWQSNGNSFFQNTFSYDGVDTNWHLASTGDFNGDGKADLLWRNDAGVFSVWQSNSYGFTQNTYVNAGVDASWHLLGAYDYNGDGKDDLLWRNDSGYFTIWQSTGESFTPNAYSNGSVDNTYAIVTHQYDIL